MFREGKLSGVNVVSIHTPPWGRDKVLDEPLTGYKFQFTRPRGGAM